MKFFVVLVALMGLGLSASAQDVPKIHLERVVRGFENPLYVISDGTDRLFVVEQPGRIKIVKNGAILPKPFLDIRKEVDFGGEKGLLSVAFHPNFKENGYIYVDYVSAKPTLHSVIAEFHVEPGADTVDPSTERILLTIEQPFPNHKGGLVMFGPDGMLYLGKGDGGKHDDPFNNAQNTDSLLGKILRIDVNKRDPYGIPKDNPFADGKGGRPEVYAWGMRNPWRFSFDALTSELYCGDVGQNDWEEVDLIVKGGNYGWRPREALSHQPQPQTCRRNAQRRDRSDSRICPQGPSQSPGSRSQHHRRLRLSWKEISQPRRLVYLRRLRQRSHLGIENGEG